MDNVFRRYWTEAERTRLLATIGRYGDVLSRRDKAWLSLLIASGFRIGEFAALSLRDAKDALASGWLFLPREIRKGRKVDHQVPVTKPIERALKDLIAIRREMGAGQGDNDPLVISRKGKRRLAVRTYQARVEKWCAEAGVEGTPHFARHTRAMQIMRNSTAPDPRGLVKAALGHATLESTAPYTGVTKEDLQRELEILDGAPRLPKSELRRRYEERRAA